MKASRALATPDRPVEQCRDIFRQQIVAAIAELAGSKPSVHNARKQLKRARATLRLLRPVIGDELYRRENVAARDAARPLSRARDDEVLGEARDNLLVHFDRKTLRVQIQPTSPKLRDAELSRIRTALRSSMRRAQAWQLEVEGWDCIMSGLRATYRRGRRALRDARKDRATEDLHEWRKQTKYLWHQLQVLAPLAPGPIGELADQFHHLADYLGDEHDLAVLRERVGASHELDPLIATRRKELQDKALALGERLYGDKSKAFVRQLERHWA